MKKQRVSEICFEALSTRSTWSTRNADTFQHNLKVALSQLEGDEQSPLVNHQIARVGQGIGL